MVLQPSLYVGQAVDLALGLGQSAFELGDAAL